MHIQKKGGEKSSLNAMKELFRNEANWENKETFFLEGEKKNFNLKPEIGKVEEQRVPEK